MLNNENLINLPVQIYMKHINIIDWHSRKRLLKCIVRNWNSEIEGFPKPREQINAQLAFTRHNFERQAMICSLTGNGGWLAMSADNLVMSKIMQCIYRLTFEISVPGFCGIIFYGGDLFTKLAQLFPQWKADKPKHSTSEPLFINWIAQLQVLNINKLHKY